jgi:putative endonuclease
MASHSPGSDEGLGSDEGNPHMLEERGMTLRSRATKGRGGRKTWFVYMLRCRGGSLYVGITNNLKERLEEHNAGEAAAWTRARRPAELVFAEAHSDKSSARRREIEIKDWRRAKKLLLTRSPDSLVRRHS